MSDNEPTWHRSRWCEGGACVEVAAAGDAVMVRSSANPGGPFVVLSRSEWREFLAQVKEGGFDQL